MPEDKFLDFASLLRLALSADQMAGAHLDSRAFGRTSHGARFSLPLERLAISVDNVGGREVADSRVEFLQSDEMTSPIMRRIRLIPTTQTRGKLPFGGALPTPTMQGEFDTAAGDSDPGLSDSDYQLSSVVEVKTRLSSRSIIQSGDSELDEVVLLSHRLAIAGKLQEQILGGDGLLNNLSGIVGMAGIGAGSYAVANRGHDEFFELGEETVIDAHGRESGLVWALGTGLHSAAKGSLLEPGSDRRVLERGRLSTSGTPVQRISDGLDSTTGLLADWSAVAVPISDRLEVTINRVSKPGEWLITSRLATASPILQATGIVYALTEA